jgi:hypothetical protein
VLGPFVAVRAGQPIRLGRSKLRDLLALLAAHSPAVVSADSIVDELWRGDAPASARKLVQKPPNCASWSAEPTSSRRPADPHQRWAADIAETQGHAPNFPVIADPDRVVSDL